MKEYLTVLLVLPFFNGKATLLEHVCRLNYHDFIGVSTKSFPSRR